MLFNVERLRQDLWAPARNTAATRRMKVIGSMMDDQHGFERTPRGCPDPTGARRAGTRAA